MFTAKYKRYLDDHSVPVPKSTKLDRDKRSATRSNTASHLDSSVGLSTKLAVVLTESIASHNGETFARETEATICHYNGAFKDISCQEQKCVSSLYKDEKGMPFMNFKI
ncbi:hypothetical protein pdam_00009191, partial [Pocillopora damicornis]